MQHSSIKFRLSLAFYLFLFLVVFLGVFNILCLHDFNEVADQVRNRWLPATRYLGDLNNYTSDFRAAEGTLLFAGGAADISASEEEMQALDNNIAGAEQGYEHLYHEDKEKTLYKQFLVSWDTYRQLTREVLDLVRKGKKDEGIRIYKTTSRTAYNAASDTLGYLTDLNAAEDREASGRVAATYNKVRLLALAAMAAGLLMMIVGVLYIRRSISTPMLGFADVMHRLAVNNMNVEINGTSRNDEIGEMARALTIFRNNAIDLMLSRQGLAKQASMLAERLEHERSLMNAQRNFITMMSHEFRTPLNIIDGHAQRLMKNAQQADAADIGERLAKIRSAVKQVTDLIDNLHATRLFDSNPELYFHPVEIDLVALLKELCSQHRVIISGAQIVEKFSTEPVKISGDSKLLQQLFSNLISNAIKYSPGGGMIEVGMEKGAGMVTVTVRDHGVGIPQKDIGSIFERYSRGSNVPGISGTGIGLYLARMIAELHEGKITAESTEGEGSAFTVRLLL